MTNHQLDQISGHEMVPNTFSLISRFQNTHLIQYFTLALSLMPILGCVFSVNGKHNTSHHIVIGFGIVSTNEAPDHAVVATDVNAFGITLDDRPGLKFGIGYTSSTVVTIAPGATDVRVEVSKPLGGPLSLNIPSAKMEEDNDRSSGKRKKAGAPLSYRRLLADRNGLQ